MKKYFAEALGTFALTLVVALSLSGSFPVPTPFLAALVIGLFVYSVGHISGAHFNPAVTVGVWSIKKISDKEALKYIVAQFIGAGIAALVFSMVNSSPAMTSIAIQTPGMILAAEFLGMFFFAFGIASVVYGKTPSQFSGVVIGGSLLLGVGIASLMGSDGFLNPALAFGVHSFNLMYLLGPIVGSALGMHAYKYLES